MPPHRLQAATAWARRRHAAFRLRLSPLRFEEVAAVLDEAVLHARGGPPYVIGAARWHLAAALNAAGFHVVRAPSDARQLTL